MSGFDIENLLEFHPARKWCLNCLALWEDFAWESSNDEYLFWGNSQDIKWDYNALLIDIRNNFAKCKICGVKYIATQHYQANGVIKFIDQCIDLPLKNIDNVIEHGKKLALLSRKIRTQKEKFPPLRVLLMALIEARSFVHFISWGITQLMIGALKVAAQRVPVSGIVSGSVGEHIISEVNEFKHEAPNLNIMFCEPAGFRGIDIPHQKLVVIDGLLAFKGSANLTQMSWRSAEKGMEIIEVVSNIDEIISLHNQFFSPIWGKMNSDGDEIFMDA